MKKKVFYSAPKINVAEIAIAAKAMLCTSDTKGSDTETFGPGDELDVIL